VRWIGVLVLLAGCKQVFGLSSPVHGDATADSVPDGGPCSGASVECVGDVLRTCTAEGVLPVDTSCTWGCGGAPAHCLAVVPAGGVVTMADVLPDTTLADVSLSNGTVVINGDTGAIGTPTKPQMVRPSGAGTLNGIAYDVRNGVAVFRFGSLAISATTTPVGANAIALVAAGRITTSGDIDALSPCRGNGLLGGFGAGAGPGAGQAGTTSRGGGGGGHGGSGGQGGNNAGSPGAINGDDTITMLVGGSGGGSVGTSTGGAGGGALQIVSGTMINISAGINVGGCGGAQGSTSTTSAGGGGAGGTLLIEAPLVSVPGTFAVNGGGGGGIAPGANGALSRNRAPGGGGGGPGAAGSFPDGGDGIVSGGAAAGGGGGIGRIRINTRDGMADLPGGSTFSPSPSDPSSTCTIGTATLQ
jgi:hypothetical protein